MKPVIILSQAEEELWQAVDFYEEKVPGLGLDLERAVRKALISIQKSPQTFPQTSSGSRRYLLQRFPFAIYYHEEAESINVIAFAHTRRKPFYWIKR